jgi:hypothetical protein
MMEGGCAYLDDGVTETCPGTWHLPLAMEAVVLCTSRVQFSRLLGRARVCSEYEVVVGLTS